jgi:hypothetical protein
MRCRRIRLKCILRDLQWSVSTGFIWIDFSTSWTVLDFMEIKMMMMIMIMIMMMIQDRENWYAIVNMVINIWVL